MKYRLGDTVRLHVSEPPQVMNKDDLDRQLRETLIAMAEGTVPEYAKEKYRDIVLTTQEMVDEYNDKLDQ